MNKTFLTEVKTKRKEKKLSQESVAMHLGITRRAYISFEKGESNFKTKERLQKLCDLLEIICPQENESKIKRAKIYEINRKSYIYESLVKAGLAIPGDRITITIEEQD